MTELAFKNAAMLRILADPEQPLTLIKDLAAALSRDPANTRRALELLRAEGLVATDALALTPKGRRVLDGIDVTEGRVNLSALTQPTPDLAALPVWPLEKIIPNPDNRKVDPDTVPDMADSLVEQGQLQAITLTPVDAAGMRMLLIGERRWLGACMARDQGRLPEALQAGLRFEERAATDDEIAGIVLVENIQRQSIPPLEQAFLFARYSDRHGVDGKPLGARETARRLGMERNERDISDKIRVARNATPEALAAYADDGSWDRLRDSIPSTRKAPEKADDQATLSLLAQVALIEIGWAITFRPFTDHGGAPAALTNGYAYMSEGLRELRTAGLTEEAMPLVWGRLACMVWPTEAGWRWIESQIGSRKVSGGDLADWRDKEAVDPRQMAIKGPFDEGFVTEALNAAQLRGNLASARRTIMEPTTQQVLMLAEIGHKIATRPDWTKGEDRALFRPDIDQFGELIGSFVWAGVVESQHLKGRDLIRLTETAREILARQGMTGFGVPTLHAARIAAGFDPDEAARLTGANQYATAWLNTGSGSVETDPLVVNGIRFPNAARATEAKRLAGLIPNPSNTGGGTSLKAVLEDMAEEEAAALKAAITPIPDRTRLVLIEVAHKVGEQRRPLDPVHPDEWTGDPHADFVAFSCTCGAHWLDGAVQAAIADGWIEVVQIPGGHPAMLTLTGKAVGAFMRGQDELPALPVSDSALIKAQDYQPSLNGGLYITESLALETRFAGPGDAMAAAVAEGHFATADAPVDLWDRDADQIAADAALLDRVKIFAASEGEAIPGDTALSLLQALGVDPSAEVTDAGGVFFETEHGPAELITVDAGGRLPDTRAAALAWLIAWAVETAIGGEAN